MEPTTLHQAGQRAQHTTYWAIAATDNKYDLQLLSHCSWIVPCRAPGVVKGHTRPGRPGVSLLWLGEIASLISNFYLIVAARALFCSNRSSIYNLHVAWTYINRETFKKKSKQRNNQRNKETQINKQASIHAYRQWLLWNLRITI